MKSVLLVFAAAAAAFGACSSIQTGSSLYGPAGTGISFGGFVPGSATSTFRRDISADSVSSHSAAWLGALGGGIYLPNDASHNINGYWEGVNFHVVGGSQRRIAVRDNPSPRETYPGDSDPGTFPIPPKARIQEWYNVLAPHSGPTMYQSRPFGFFLDLYQGPADQKFNLIDRDNCIDYELYGCYDDGSNISCASYSAYYLAGGDLQRPYNLTGGDSVSGMPQMFGLLRKDEWLAGVINHAIGITTPYTNNVAMTGAASHAQCCGAWTSTQIPFGARIRLKASYDASSWDPGGSFAPLITALKKYGLAVYDGGADGAVYSDTAYLWNPAISPVVAASNLILNATNFEVVDTGAIYCVGAQTGCPGGNAPTGSAPAIASLTASRASGNVTVRWSVSGVVDADGNAVPLRNLSWGKDPTTACTIGGANPCKFGPGWINSALHGEGVVVPDPGLSHLVVHLMVQNRYGRTEQDLTAY